MLIVGELINSSCKTIARAIETRDFKVIQTVAKEQREAGANFIDVNAGIFGEQEVESLKWLVTSVQEAVDTPCCIDSPDPRAIEAALEVHRGTAMINSISLEKERFKNLLPIVAGTDFKVVALCISEDGMPEFAQERLTFAEQLVNGLVKNNVPLNNIYVDPLVQPISMNTNFGWECLKAVGMIMNRFKGVHTICGISNISYGLPNRKLLNRTFAAMAIAKGLDSLILNPLDQQLMANVIAAEAIKAKDNFCEMYLKAHRAEKFRF